MHKVHNVRTKQQKYKIYADSQNFYIGSGFAQWLQVGPQLPKLPKLPKFPKLPKPLVGFSKPVASGASNP